MREIKVIIETSEVERNRLWRFVSIMGIADMWSLFEINNLMIYRNGSWWLPISLCRGDIIANVVRLQLTSL